MLLLVSNHHSHYIWRYHIYGKAEDCLKLRMLEIESFEQRE